MSNEQQFDVFGEPIDTRTDWEKEWKGMPEFSNSSKKEYAAITVRIETEEDLAKFEKLIDQTLIIKNGKASIWFPKYRRNSLVSLFV